MMLQSRRSKGFAFVRFMEKAAADEAVKGMDGQVSAPGFTKECEYAVFRHSHSLVSP